jgi:adenine-specific DNA methylase
MKETRTVNPLLEAVKKWSDRVLGEALEELAIFYPHDSDGSIPIGYIWARTIPCQNPGCSAEIPLMRQFWLARKSNKKVALYPEVRSGQVAFHLVGDGYNPWPPGFDPEAGTVSQAVVTCLACGAKVDAQTNRRLFQEGEAGQQMLAVVLHHLRRKGKTYRVALAADEQVYEEAKAVLEARREQLMLEWGLDPVPEEAVPTTELRRVSVPLYGMTQWADLFNARQQLALITFADRVRHVYQRMIEEGAEPDFAKAVTTYLGIALSRFTNRMASLAYWYISTLSISP